MNIGYQVIRISEYVTNEIKRQKANGKRQKTKVKGQKEKWINAFIVRKADRNTDELPKSKAQC